MLYVSWFLFAVNIKSIKPTLDLHLMSSSCTVCMDSTNKTIFLIFIIIIIMMMMMMMMMMMIITIIIAVISERD